MEDGGARIGAAAWHLDFEAFCEANRHWLDDFASVHGAEGAASRRRMDTWEPGARDRDPKALGQVARASWPRQIASQKFLQFVFLRAVARAARICARARGADHGRPADLCRARQRRRVGQSAIFSVGRAGQSYRGLRRSSGLFQRDRPALGQSDLSLGRAGDGRLRLVAGSISRGV